MAISKTRTRKKTSKAAKATRAGAAAFAIGLYLAGPQVGFALADGADANGPGPSSKAADASNSSPARGKAPTSRRGTRPAPASAESAATAPQPVEVSPEPAAADPAEPAEAAAGQRSATPGAARAGRTSAARSDSRPAPAAARRSGQPVITAPAPAAGGAGESAGAPAAATSSAVLPSSAAPAAAPAPTAAVAPQLAPALSASAFAAPFSAPAARPPVPPVLEKIEAQVNTVVQTVFRGLVNWMSTLPVNPFTSWLEGGLLMIRKSLLNQTASINAIQTANTSQLVTGKIDVVDPEGDGWTIELAGDPTYGTVVLGTPSQANGIGTTKYTYTPGEGYTGVDSFVVKVAPSQRIFNILDPFGLFSTRYYTVAVGDAAQQSNSCFGCMEAATKDTLDTTLFLGNAGATVSVQKQGLLFPRYTATVTMSQHAANQAFAWMDVRGRTGFVSVDRMLTEDWAAFEQKATQNAVKPLLAFVYSDQDGDKAVFVDVSAARKNPDGTYQFTGQLMADSPAQNGRVDAWDFLGIDYKSAYENFLTASNLRDCKSGAVCSSVTTMGILAATTLSPSAYRDVGGHDYALPTPSVSSAYQTSPGSIGPGTVNTNEGTGTAYFGNTGSGDTFLTAMIPWGTDGSFINGTNLAQTSKTNNGVYLYTANAPAGSEPTWAGSALFGNGWDAAVNVMTSWDQVVVDANGDVVPAAFSGSLSNNVLTLSLANSLNPGILIGQSITGAGLAEDTVITEFVSASGGTATYIVNNAVAPTGTTTITTPNIPTVQPGVVVGLSDGSVQYWNGGGCSQTASGCDSSVTSQAYGQGWTQLQASNDAGWGSGVAVNTVVSLPNNHGFVVGLSNGEVYLWNNPVLADGTIIPGPSAGGGCSGSDVGSCWKQLRGTGGGQVTAMIPSGVNGGFVIGMSLGSVQQWNPDSGEFVELASNLGGAVMTLVPYDATTFVGAIAGTPVAQSAGVISEPYGSELLNESAVLAASVANCQSSYNSGSGTGCGGYVLTVQWVAGNPIKVGQTLYGGAGLAPRTTITQQISDGFGNLCSVACYEGSDGVYLVDTAQLVAPGSPMSASDGTGFIVGTGDGSVQQWNPVTGEFVELHNDGWGSPVNAMIPWRDGVVVGLNNGATFYWSPSNNPGGNNPDNPNALPYTGSTVTSQNSQASGWSQLQGTGWDNAVTAMVPIGDGFALGLTAPNSKNNGAVMLFTGFGPASSTSAFGYSQSGNGPVALTASNSFTQIANQSALSGDSSYGSVQQMIPVTGYVTDSAGNLVLGQSVIAGLTNNGIYVWTGSTQDLSTTSWATLQQPGTGGKPTLSAAQLQSAWAYGNASNSNTAWGATGGVGATYVPGSGSTPASGDPVFGLSSNQAWCGSSCSSYGDYTPLVFSKQYGTDGSILSFGTTVQTDVDLSSLTYGYMFAPNSIIDKFIPGKYSVGMLVAFQGGPVVTLNMDGNTSATVTENVTGPSESWYEPTEVGTFGLTVGLNAGVTAGIDLTNAPSGPVVIAEALYTPGLLYTWNVNGYNRKMSLSYDYYPTVDYITEAEAANYLSENATLTITPEVTPYISSSYGLFTPPSTPLIGEWTVFDLGLGYQNPISFTLSAPVSDPANLSMSVTSQGFITANAGFLPDVTSLLTWNGKYQVYSVTDQIMS